MGNIGVRGRIRGRGTVGTGGGEGGEGIGMKRNKRMCKRICGGRGVSVRGKVEEEERE